MTSGLVHYGQASDVESVMVGGNWIMKDGIVLTMDEEATIEDAQLATIEAWERLHTRWPDIEMPPVLQRSKD